MYFTFSHCAAVSLDYLPFPVPPCIVTLSYIRFAVLSNPVFICLTASAMSCLVLIFCVLPDLSCCPIPSYLILSQSILPYLPPFDPIHSIPPPHSSPYSALLCLILSYPILCYPIPSYPIPYYPIRYSLACAVLPVQSR